MSKTKDRVALLSDNKNISTGITKPGDSWSVMSQVTNYTNSIEVGQLSLENPNLYSIITAIPSPWVRSYITKNALSFSYITQTQKREDSFEGMGALYSALQDEYKGVLACMCLYMSELSVEKIDLVYPEFKQSEDDNNLNILKSAYNIYDLPGALGNLLFEERDLWLPTDTKPNQESIAPYLLLISMGDTVIAGVSPQTLIYPAASYELKDSNIPFYRGGRFRDPLDYLEFKDITKLLYYIRKLREQLNLYIEEFHGKNKIISFISLFSFFREFEQEIRNQILKIDPDYNLDASGIVDFCDKFKGYMPYSKIFDIDAKIYKTPDGRYLIENETGDLPEFNPSQLLLPVENTKLVKLSGDFDFQNTPVLSAKDEEGREHIFTLPFSHIGISEFQNEIKDVLGQGTRGFEHDKIITAKYDTRKKKLEVTLRLEISGSDTHFSKIYQVANSEEPLVPDIQIWPNFISKYWSSYYTCSNIPHSGRGIKVLPLLAEETNFERIRFNDDGSLYHFENDRYQKDTNVVVDHDYNLQNEKAIKYEIFESKVPFLGFELKISSQHLDDAYGGYLLLNNLNILDVADDTKGNYSLESVNVAIDFGSTNTSVSYLDRSNQIHNLNVKPKKLDLFTINNQHRDGLKVGDLFFFQDQTQEKPFRSALLQHDTKRLKDPTLLRSRAISGGISVQLLHLPVVSGDKSKLKVKYGDEITDVIYDLKWKREDRYLVNKKAFLKNIWLLTCAELFINSKRPAKLNWSYPSSMPRDLIRTYEGIFEEIISEVDPIITQRKDIERVRPAKINTGSIHDQAITESEAICNYALTRGNVSIAQNNVFVGIDIGGITSDILLVTNDPGDKRGLLLKQSSVKIAGDRLAKIIGSSESIKSLLRHFVRSNNVVITDIDQIGSETAGYYTNLLFDLLEDDERLEQSFYNTIWAPDDEELNRSETRGLIAVPAYICGLLLFHSGQLLASSIDDDEEQDTFNLKDRLAVTVSSFGKGGKLFDWLPTAFGDTTATEYYKQCFELGLGVSETVRSMKDSLQVRFEHRKGERNDLKREVSMGLVTQRGLIRKHANAENDIIGEKGYFLEDENDFMPWGKSITPDHIYEIGEKFRYPKLDLEKNHITGLEHFDIFLRNFLDFVRIEGIIDSTVLVKNAESFVENYLENYVKSDEDYLASSRINEHSDEIEDFSFSASPFLLQGACFLDKVLIPNIYRIS